MRDEIEKFLDLSKEEIETRKGELIRKLRTYPGLSYLKVRLKKFKVQPWPFIGYLAYYCRDLLKEGLDMYADYDGPENREAIMEQLREEYVSFLLLDDIEKNRIKPQHHLIKNNGDGKCQ